MSLQVWLPLTKDLRNQGVKNVTINAKAGVTIDNNGKLGKCYTFANSTTGNLTFSSSISPSVINGVTVAAWIYLNGSNTDRGLFSNQSGGPVNFSFEINNSKLSVYHYNGSWIRHTGTTILSTGVWYHIAYVCQNNKCTFYINGIPETTTVDCPISSSYSGNIPLDCLGSRWSNSAPFNGKINDFRLYNNALSANEIKDIARGLMIHYPLNRQELGQENLFKNSSLTDLTSANLSSKIYYQGSYIPEITQDGLKFTWTGSSAREIDLWLDKTLKADTYYTLSFIYRNNMAIGSSFYLRKDGSLVGYWSQPTIPYSEDWSTYKCTFKITNYQSNDATTGTLLTLFYSGYTANKWIELKQNSIKLEEGSISTPWSPAPSDTLATQMGLNSNIEYDCSGFGYNADKANITYDSDFPKYSTNAVLNGSNSYIKTQTNDWMSQGTEQLTINIWAKATTWPANGGRIISCTETGGFNLEAGNSGYWRFPMYVYTASGKTSPAYKYDSNEIKISDLIPNQWNMITCVYDAAQGTKTYINGVLNHTYNNVSYGICFANTNSRLYLGCEANGVNPYTPYFNGKLSDFRMYATALSADDIKSLYHNEAYIDSNGKIYGEIR